MHQWIVLPPTILLQPFWEKSVFGFLDSNFFGDEFLRNEMERKRAGAKVPDFWFCPEDNDGFVLVDIVDNQLTFHFLASRRANGATTRKNANTSTTSSVA